MDDALRRGRDHWNSGELAAAEAAFREALAARPDHPEALPALAGVLADQDRFDAALRVLDRSNAGRVPPSPDPYGRLRADIFRRSGRVERSIALLREVVERDPAARSAWNELALDLATSGRQDEAEQVLAQALERMPRDPQLWAARGMIAALSGHAVQAVEAYEMASRCAGETPRAWRLLLKTHLANALDMAGDLPRAIATYEEVIAEDEDAHLAHVQLGIVLWRHERFSEAARVLSHAVERWPEDHDAAYYLADAERSLGRRDEAERGFRASIERWPECANCLYGLAQVVQEDGRSGEAALLLRHVLAVRPDDPDAVGLFAEARFDIGETAAARELFEQAIKLAPGEVRHLYNFALRERDAGRLEAATALFDRALAVAPRLDRALYFAAVCRTERGLRQEAVPYLERFVTQAPPSRAIVRADPILDPLKSLPRYRDLVGGSLLDFAAPDAPSVRPALESLARELPEGDAAGSGATAADAVGEALAAAVRARDLRGAWRPPPRFYFDTVREGPCLVIAERDAARPAAPARRIAVIGRLRDGSFRTVLA